MAATLRDSCEVMFGKSMAQQAAAKISQDPENAKWFHAMVQEQVGLSGGGLTSMLWKGGELAVGLAQNAWNVVRMIGRVVMHAGWGIVIASKVFIQSLVKVIVDLLRELMEIAMPGTYKKIMSMFLGQKAVAALTKGKKVGELHGGSGGYKQVRTWGRKDVPRRVEHDFSFWEELGLPNRRAGRAKMVLDEDPLWKEMVLANRRAGPRRVVYDNPMKELLGTMKREQAASVQVAAITATEMSANMPFGGVPKSLSKAVVQDAVKSGAMTKALVPRDIAEGFTQAPEFSESKALVLGDTTPGFTQAPGFSEAPGSKAVTRFRKPEAWVRSDAAEETREVVGMAALVPVQFRPAMMTVGALFMMINTGLNVVIAGDAMKKIVQSLTRKALPDIKKAGSVSQRNAIIRRTLELFATWLTDAFLLGLLSAGLAGSSILIQSVLLTAGIGVSAAVTTAFAGIVGIMSASPVVIGALAVVLSIRLAQLVFGLEDGTTVIPKAIEFSIKVIRLVAKKLGPGLKKLIARFRRKKKAVMQKMSKEDFADFMKDVELPASPSRPIRRKEEEMPKAFEGFSLRSPTRKSRKSRSRRSPKSRSRRSPKSRLYRKSPKSRLYRTRKSPTSRSYRKSTTSLDDLFAKIQPKSVRSRTSRSRSPRKSTTSLDDLFAKIQPKSVRSRTSRTSRTSRSPRRWKK